MNLRNEIYDWIVETVDEVKDQVFDGIESVVSEGADTMREVISTKGATNPWKRDWTWMQDREGKPHRFGSAPGRVHTGKMLDAVESDVKRGATHMVAEFGWLDEGKYADYFMHQEHGFQNVMAKVTVEGMHALATAATVAETSLSNVVKRANG